MKNHLQVFWLLFTAYTISVVYQFYRYTIHQYPEFDTFGVFEIIQYSILFGLSGLALIRKKWAVKAVISFCSIQLFVGVFLYIPIIFIKRHDTFWDWAENFGFLALIALAGYNAILLLRNYQNKSIPEATLNKPFTGSFNNISVRG